MCLSFIRRILEKLNKAFDKGRGVVSLFSRFLGLVMFGLVVYLCCADAVGLGVYRYVY
jgi:hypothetical protein